MFSHTHEYTHTPSMAFSQDNLGKPAIKWCEIFLHLNELRDNGVEVASAEPNANHLHTVLC